MAQEAAKKVGEKKATNRKSKLPEWMLMQQPKGKQSIQQYVMHTRFPRFIAKIIESPDDRMDIEMAEIIDEPKNREKDIPVLLSRAAKWHFDNYM